MLKIDLRKWNDFSVKEFFSRNFYFKIGCKTEFEANKRKKSAENIQTVSLFTAKKSFFKAFLRVLGRCGAWGVTACFKQTQQQKRGYPSFGWRAVMLKNTKILRSRGARGSSKVSNRNWGLAYLTCELSICWGVTLLDTHGRRGATVTPKFIEETVFNLGKLPV